METCIALFDLFVTIVIFIIGTVLCVGLAIVILMTLWALVKPYVNSVIDRYLDWYNERTE